MRRIMSSGPNSVKYGVQQGDARKIVFFNAKSGELPAARWGCVNAVVHLESSINRWCWDVRTLVRTRHRTGRREISVRHLSNVITGKIALSCGLRRHKRISARDGRRVIEPRPRGYRAESPSFGNTARSGKRKARLQRWLERRRLICGGSSTAARRRRQLDGTSRSGGVALRGASEPCSCA